MNEHVANYHYEDLEVFAITVYLASMSGKLEAHAECLLKYSDMSNEHFSNKLTEIVKSLNEVREFLHDNNCPNIELNK